MTNDFTNSAMNDPDCVVGNTVDTRLFNLKKAIKAVDNHATIIVTRGQEKDDPLFLYNYYVTALTNTSDKVRLQEFRDYLGSLGFRNVEYCPSGEYIPTTARNAWHIALTTMAHPPTPYGDITLTAFDLATRTMRNIYEYDNHKVSVTTVIAIRDAARGLAFQSLLETYGVSLLSCAPA